jgi:UDP-N-acetylglucosamine--N-acetylmuramyl-(pentapeptide) pyrophosphoryl-undecaprenol N-acetylglucosamine transferase
VGKPVILIPSPHVAENHQVKNAETISSKDAAIMIEEKNLEDVFQNAWSKLISDAELRDKLSDNIKSLALPNATKDIVDIIEKLIHD